MLTKGGLWDKNTKRSADVDIGWNVPVQILTLSHCPFADGLLVGITILVAE